LTGGSEERGKTRGRKKKKPGSGQQQGAGDEQKQGKNPGITKSAKGKKKGNAKHVAHERPRAQGS